MEGYIKGEKERTSVGLTLGFEVINLQILRSPRCRIPKPRLRTKISSSYKITNK